jgi:flagellar hook assembly protein FlgD
MAGAGVFRVRTWPNPVVEGAAISYNLPARADVSVCVYDIAGRLVSTLARGSMAAGDHEARWNPRSAGGSRSDAGIYMVEVRAGTQRSTMRVAVL